MIDNCIYTKKDFQLDQPVKWCPGCGGHAVLSSIQNTMPEIGVKKENVVFVSGIGCSSRFPYYINTYGFHSLHGRAFPIAQGVKLANPELSVWVVTGDGDSMAIGGNHFIHSLRRNLNINILLFNNKIYGLTKGQYSPTSPKGSVTKTSPEGTLENPFKPGELAMGAMGTFYARAVDTNPQMMKEVFLLAAKHNGTSLVEILENCVIFNDKIHKEITDKELREDNQIYLEHGKPMLFGKNKEKGLVLDGLSLKVVELGKNGITIDHILVHDAHKPDNPVHYMLASMSLPDFPVAMGVIRSIEASVFEEVLTAQLDAAKSKIGPMSVQDVLEAGHVFEV